MMKNQIHNFILRGFLLAAVAIGGSAFYSEDTYAIEFLDCQGIGNRIPYKPFSLSRLDSARNRFNQSFQNLHFRLGKQGEEFFNNWMKYLHGTKLVGRYQHNYKEISIFRRWLFSNQEGMEHSAFAAIKRDIIPYSDALYTAQYVDLYREHVAHQQGLVSACMAVNVDPIPENLLALQTHLTWFGRTQTDNGIASGQFSAWRRPNIRLQIPARFITDKFYEKGATVKDQGPVDETFHLPIGFRGKNKPVRSTGQASTYGNATIHLIPSLDTARFMVKVNGNINANTLSQSGPVSSQTHSTSIFESRAILDVTLEGIALQSVASDVNIQSMNTQYKGTTSRPLLNGLFSKIARKKSQKPAVQASIKAQSKEATRRQLKEKIQEQVGSFTMDKGVATKLQKTIADKMGNLGNNMTKAFKREGVKINKVSLGTTHDHVAVRLELGDRSRLLALDREPFNPSPSDIHLAFHQSLLKNMFQVTYSGKWVHDDYFEKPAELMYTKIPKELHPHGRKENWAIKYADINPITFQLLSQEQIIVTVRLAGFRRREPGAKKWIVTMTPATYQITYRVAEDKHGKAYLEKTHRVAMVPNQINLPSEDKAFIDRMEDRINAFLGENINMGGLIFPKGGPMANLADVKILNLNLSNGWISFNVANLPKILEK